MNKKVYLICHEFSPSQGSECKSGFNIACELSKYVNLTVVAAESNQWGTCNYKKAFDNFDFNCNFNVIWVPQPKLYNRDKKFGTSLLSQILYFYRLKKWNIKVNECLQSHQIDILHYYNHISFRAYDSIFSSLSKIIFIGPTSGIQSVPFSFLKFGMLFNSSLILKNLLNNIQLIFSKRKYNVNNIKTIFTVTRKDYEFFSNFSCDVIPLMDVALDSLSTDPIPNYKSSTPLSLLWVGRLDNLKCLDIILDVFKDSAFINKSCNLTVLGDGLNFQKYDEIITKNNLNITLKGKVSLDVVSEYMRNSDLLLHSSIKEASGTVLTEALSNKLPVMCHDSFGFTVFHSGKYVIKIPYITYNKSVYHFKKEISRLINNPSILFNLKNEILRSHKNLTWNDHANIIYKQYKKYDKFI